MSECIFCKIVEGEIPARKVYEDEDVVAILDISQVTKGHTLVISKEHVRNIFDYSDELASSVFSKVPDIARAIKAANPASKGMHLLMNNEEIASQSVFHGHIHLLPRYSNADGFGLKWEAHTDDYSQEDLDEIMDAIKTELN